MKKLIFILLILIIGCINNYEKGGKQYDKKDYAGALLYFKEIEENDKNYKDAQLKILEIDSILKQIEEEKLRQVFLKAHEAKRQDSINKIEKSERFKTTLQQEIKDIKTFDGKIYREDIYLIQVETSLFKNWAELIQTAENSNDKKTNKLGKTLKWNLIALQKREYPKLRKSYGKILRDKLWIENIKVKITGSRYTILEFEGATFANNKNIQTTQELLQEILHLLKFKKTKYKWYEYAEEYTYYTLKTKNDGDLVK